MTDNLPTFSIVIPTHNRPRQIVECLNAISRLQYPAERFEVVIVDDGASLLPENFLKFRDKFPLVLHQQKQAGPAAARNKGAELSRFDYLAFTDDDCLPDKDWLAQLARQFKLLPEACLGGRTINALSDNVYSAASQQLVDYLYGYFEEKNSDLNFFTSNNLAVSRAGFERIGGFDPTFPLPAAEDRDFCRRWLEEGFRLVCEPQALVFHAHRMNFRGFCRQHFNYGRGALYFHKKVAARTSGEIKREPLGFYLNLLSFPLKREFGWRNLKISNLLFASQAATAAGYFYQSFRHE